MNHSSNNPPEWIDKMTLRNITGTVANKLHCYWLLRGVWDLVRDYTPSERATNKRLKILLSSFIKKGDLVFDIGANRGNYTALMLELGAKVIAVEPNVKLYKKLEYRFIYDFDMVEVLWTAVSNIEGTYKVLYSCEDHGLSSMSPEYIESVDKVIFPKYTWNKEQLVPTITLQRLMETYGVPTFIKMDIEGYERVALHGMDKPVNCMSIEYARSYPQGIINSVNRLDDIGTKYFNYTKYAEHELKLERWVGKEAIISILLSMADKYLWGDIYAKKNGVLLQRNE